MHTMYIEKYLENLDHEICELIESESKKMTERGEHDLHILMENRKHAKRMMEEKHGGMHNPGMMDMGDNPNKSYFGGMKL